MHCLLNVSPCVGVFFPLLDPVRCSPEPRRNGASRECSTHERSCVDKGGCCCFNVVLNLSHTLTSQKVKEKVPKPSNRWTFSSPALPVAVAPESVRVDRGGGRVENHHPHSALRFSGKHLFHRQEKPEVRGNSFRRLVPQLLPWFERWGGAGRVLPRHESSHTSRKQRQQKPHERKGEVVRLCAAPATMEGFWDDLNSHFIHVRWFEVIQIGRAHV